MQNIADILPDNLSEETVNRIAELVNETIEEELSARLEGLSRKFATLMRLKVDEHKKLALAELELENETFRKAELMESVLGAMALEVSPTHVDDFTKLQLNEASEVMKESEILESELELVLEEKQKLENTLEIVNSKLNKLDKENTKLKIQLEHKQDDQQKVRLNGQAKLETKESDRLSESRTPSSRKEINSGLAIDIDTFKRLAGV